MICQITNEMKPTTYQGDCPVELVQARGAGTCLVLWRWHQWQKSGKLGPNGSSSHEPIQSIEYQAPELQFIPNSSGASAT